MASAKIPAPGRSEVDHGSRLAEFEALSRELADKELDLATLENELSEFETRYAAQVGILFAELDVLDREIARELMRLHPEDKYRQGFRQAERKAETSQDAVNEKVKQPEKKPYRPTEEIKNLYRKVAKIIHPDLATSESERAYRTALMARANAAYKAGDKQALEQILYEWEHGGEKSFFTRPELEPSDQLDRLIAQIKDRLQELDRRIAGLKKSELYQLMLKVERADREGRDLLGEMAKDLQRKIQAAQELLDSLKQQERA